MAASAADNVSKPRTTVLGNDLVYRTVPLSKAQAERFCKCQNANPRVAGASVEAWPYQKDKYVVCWVPANPDRQEDMMDRYVAQRALTALAEGDDWEWDANDAGSEHVYTPHRDAKTGEIVFHAYKVTDSDCECPDFQYRGKRIGKPCKHICKRQERRASGQAHSVTNTVREMAGGYAA